MILLTAVMVMSGCSAGSEAAGSAVADSADIYIPVSGAEAAESFTVAEAERYDVEEYLNIGADVSYVFAETLTVPYDTNLSEYNVRYGDRLNEGDIIAVFDSSAFGYDIKNQEAVTESARERYLSSGSEAARLEYEEDLKQLELIRYNADRCTIRAPYDCVICGVERIEVGEAVEAGRAVCRVARPQDTYISVKGNNDVFAFGMPVSVKFGTKTVFPGRVVMMPENSKESVLILLDDGELEKANEETGGIASAGWGTVIVKDYTALNVLCVPEKAVMSYLGETYCYVEDNGGRARVPVETGKTVNGLTVILSGLTDGDKVLY